MEHALVEMMSNFMDLIEDEKQAIRDAFPMKSYDKNTILLKEGEISKNAYVVLEGCIRKYYFKDGEEITSEFYTEYQSAAHIDSIVNNKPSKFYFVCSEPTTVAIMNVDEEEKLYKRYPHFAEVCRVEMEKMLGASQDKLLNYVHSSPEERYLNLVKDRPDLLQRVPQYQLASYLGIKPETLSRIRKRISSKF